MNNHSFHGFFFLLLWPNLTENFLKSVFEMLTTEVLLFILILEFGVF